MFDIVFFFLNKESTPFSKYKENLVMNSEKIIFMSPPPQTLKFGVFRSTVTSKIKARSPTPNQKQVSMFRKYHNHTLQTNRSAIEH